MPDGSGERKRKRKGRNGDERWKLLPGEKVEVLYTEEGLNGSWHGGVVVSCGKCSRLIAFSDLLNDDNCSKLVEWVPVSAAIEGKDRKVPKKYRGQIRPAPPIYEFQESEIRYGLCVDAFLDDAWWEGVVFDHEEGSPQRLVFFPDQGDQHMIAIDQLRLTQEWNEASGSWKPRGEWLLFQVLETFEQQDALPVSIREIWYDLRTTATFWDNIGLWIFGSQSSWHSLVSELIQELLTVVHGPSTGGEIHNQLIDGPMYFNDIDIPMEDISCLEGPYHLMDNGRRHTGLATSSSRRKYANWTCSHEATEDKNVENSHGGVCGTVVLPLSYSDESNKKQKVFPQALFDFISEYRRRLAHQPLFSNKIFDATRKMAKAHLLAVGWQFKVSVSYKYYVSPDGKSYYSFIKACKACKAMESKNTMKCNSYINWICDVQGAPEADNTHVHREEKVDGRTNPVASSFWRPIYLVAEYCPEVIAQYAYGLKDGKPQKKPKAVDHNIDNVRLRARQHLLALGWKIECRRDTMIRFRFLSPEGKCYYSLHKACCHLLAGHQNKKCKFNRNSSSESVSVVRLSPVKKNKMQTEHFKHAFRRSLASGRSLLKHETKRSCNSQKSRKRKANDDLIGESYKSGCNFTPRIPRSSKRSREVVASLPTQQVARTVLSLLIDNDMVLPRQKVRYIRRRDGHVMMEGRITRDGIKCKCCTKVYTLTNFEAHAGSSCHRPAANIFLQDGRSLLECQMQMLHVKKSKNISYVRKFKHPRLKSDCSLYRSDAICSVCHDGGILVLCDHCPSSFHLGCVGLEDVPKGKWFCPSCRCGICDTSEFNSDINQFTEKTILYCDQCEREYHAGCLKERGLTTLRCFPIGNWFCSNTCSKIFLCLHKLLGKSRPTAKDDLSWTILRSSREIGVDGDQFDAETMAENHSKLCVALDVLHECFVTIIEPRTRSDLIADILFNKESELNRLNFWGFYTMLLERGDELISVAAFRVYGGKVAEMPFVATRVKYRRQGMCRLLVNELEKLLSALGVERLMLPAVPQLLETWINSFGFTKMTNSDRSDFLEYSLLNFQDTTMCQKLLRRIPTMRKKPTEDCNHLAERSSINIEEVDSNLYSKVSEVVKMVEPIKTLPSLFMEACSSPGKGGSTEEVTYLTNPVHCASPSSCTGLVGQRVHIGTREQASPYVAPDKYIDNSIFVETSPIDVVETLTDYKFLGKTDTDRGHLNRSVIVDRLNTFKYFYRRRISAN